MDLIYTNSKKIDQGVLNAYALDLSYGDDENDFSLTLGKSEAMLEYGAFVYIENTEYGGIVDGKKASTDGKTITYSGRTWHGILNSKVIEPNYGQDYYTVTGDLNDILAVLVIRLGISDLFTTAAKQAGITLSNYRFPRYCKGYDGIRKMLATAGAKLRVSWRDKKVTLSAEPIVDYSKSPIDEDTAILTVEQHEKKVNHLICLGQGELSERTVIHLYIDQFGHIGTAQYYKGLDEITDVYENTNAETIEDLQNDGIARFKELRDIDTSEMSIAENNDLVFDIGDIVGASIISCNVTAFSNVTQKIIKINNGVAETEYKVGSK